MSTPENAEPESLPCFADPSKNWVCLGMPKKGRKDFPDYRRLAVRDSDGFWDLRPAQRAMAEDLYITERERCGLPEVFCLAVRLLGIKVADLRHGVSIPGNFGNALLITTATTARIVKLFFTVDAAGYISRFFHGEESGSPEQMRVRLKELADVARNIGLQPKTVNYRPHTEG